MELPGPCLITIKHQKTEGTPQPT
uniref:Uncharacterized protein n=1 Tax=Arundo donax TaxID=35708 RepID=A0A0A8ZBL3_ARUDO